MRHAFIAAVLLLPGLSSVTFAQTLSTPYGYNGTSLAPLTQDLRVRLQNLGYTNIALEPRKHGFTGSALKDGKRVTIDYNESRGIEIK
jgi:hypothetical protein